MSPRCLTLFALLLTLAPAQGPATEASLPKHLRLKGDPAPDLDLGGTRFIPVPRRDEKQGPVTRAPFVCHRCLREKTQRVEEGAGVLENLLGRPASSIQPWLQRATRTEPVILTRGRYKLVTALGKRDVKDLQPEERLRIRLFCPDAPKNVSQLDGHHQAHLWMGRLMTLDNALADLLDLDEKGRIKALSGSSRPVAFDELEIYLFGSKDDHDAFASLVMKRDERPLEGTLTEKGPVNAVFLAKASAEALRRRFLHGATLALLQRHRRVPGGPPGWIKIGIAHFMERRLRGAREAKDEAGTLPPGFESPRDWDQFLRDLVSKGKEARLDGLTLQPGRALSLKSRIQAWSLVKFLIGVDKERFSLLVRHFMQVPPDEAPMKSLTEGLRFAYDTDAEGLERAWKLWVLRGQKKR